MRSSLRGRLTALFGLVAAITCVVLVGAAAIAAAFVLRREQDETIRSMLKGQCAAILAEAREGERDIPAAAREYFAEAGVSGYRVELANGAGEVVAASASLEGWRSDDWSLPVTAFPVAPVSRGSGERSDRFRGQAAVCVGDWRARVVTHDVLAERPARHALLALCAVVPLALGAGLWLGRAGVARVLRPLNELETAARRLHADSRLSLDVGAKPDELARLERSFDALLERLGAAIAREHDFTQQASHELRTPLTVLRARLEQCVAGTTDPTQSEHLAAIGLELNSLEALVEALLLLARSDDALVGRDFVNLCDVARRAVARQAWLDGEAAGPIDVDAPDEILLRGSEDLLERAVANLLENARRFAGARGRIQVRVARDGERATLLVEDDGPGIPESARVHVFERFFRDPAHRGSSHGAGLGLAVVRAVAARHGGTATAGRGRLGGASIRLDFPAA